MRDSSGKPLADSFGLLGVLFMGVLGHTQQWLRTTHDSKGSVLGSADAQGDQSSSRGPEQY